LTEAEADAAYDKFVMDNLKRNYAGHYVHGMLGMTGFRLVNTPTFVPAYLHSISGSDFWVGIGTSLQQLGGIVSPIIGAQQIEHRKKILPVSVTLGLLMRAQILGWLFRAGSWAGGRRWRSRCCSCSCSASFRGRSVWRSSCCWRR
jgi:cyanate permease